MPIIVENLSYVYNPKAPFKRVALNDVSLTINDGDFFGIIGSTGSGKSTLVSHFNGLKKITKGKITVDEIDLTAKYDYKKLRSRVGMVFQYPEYQLFDETVAKDVGFGARNLKLPTGEINKRVKEAIELVGLDYDLIKERSPFELSGGQMRRVALAGVLVMQPKILVLDEPTAGLDPRGKKQILELINSMRKICPTIIMISHNMNEIFLNCNKIALMNEGSLKGVYTPHELYLNSQTILDCGLNMPSNHEIAKNLNLRGFNINNPNSTVDLINQIYAEVNNER